jgi:hypothetical protein
MAKGKNFKHPPNKTSKRIQIKELPPSVNYNLQKPIFSFKYMVYQGPCCISTRQEIRKSFIIDKLLQLSQFTWDELIRQRRELAFEKIPAHRFKVPLPKILTPEVTILVARYDNEGGRLAGFRDKDVFHVVLAGRDLYPH